MTTSALIDLVIAYYDNIDATDADNAWRRLKTLQILQGVFDYVWHFRDWRFKTKHGTITVPTTGAVVVPSDFYNLPPEGGAYLSDGTKLITSTHDEIRQLQLAGLAVSNTQAFPFAIGGRHDLGSTLQYFLTPPLSASTSVSLLYEINSPTLVDTTNASTNNLYYIPVAYHQSVLVPGVYSRLAKHKGDTRDWAATFEKGLAFMVLKETPRRTGVQRLPRSMSGMW